MRESETQKNWNEYFNNPKHPTTNIRWGLIAFMIICIGCAIYFATTHSSDNRQHEINEDAYININSARNGEIMADSLDTIEYIFKDIHKKDLTALRSDMTTLDNINLSEEYNEYIKTAKLKLSHYISYKTTKDGYYLDLYNNTDMFSVLAEAFDKAGINYTLYDDRIEYSYTP